MKNLFLEKSIVQKLIIALAIVILFNFVSPTVCNAESYLARAGGALLEPIINFIIFIADSIMEILQQNFVDDVEILKSANAEGLVDSSAGWGAIGWAAGIVLIGASIIAIPFTLGASLTVTSLAVSVVVGGVTLAAAGAKINEAVTAFSGEFDIPQLVYSPFAIFANMVPLFDINFFEPNTI